MKIVVLCGGLSSERDVSLSTAAMTAAALRRLGHEVTCVDLFLGVTEPSATVSDTAPDLAALRASRPGTARVGDDVFALCQGADLVFMALHGADGEDGKIQAALDLLGVKYTGSGPLGSALAMNKSVTKQVLTQNGILMPRSTTVRLGDPASLRGVGFPYVVKPCSGGSSVGMTIVTDAAEYPAALEAAFALDEFAVIEQFVKGREFSVGVIAGRALPVIEILANDGVYDYKAKYQSGLANEVCPADLPADLTETLQRAAEAVFSALHLEVYARMDFIVGDNGKAYCLEANTLPGMTPTSLLPQEAAADGITYDELVATIVRESLKKYGEA